MPVIRTLAVILCLCASLASGQPNMTQDHEPGTKAPQDFNCGFPATTSASYIEYWISDIYDTVFRIAKITQPKPALHRLAPDGLGIAQLQETAASKPGKEIYEVDYYPLLCTTAANRDQVAFTLGHELAHLAKGHYAKVSAELAKYEKDCGSNSNACYTDKRDTLIAPMEIEADNTSFGYLSTPDPIAPPFKAAEGRKLFNHFKDLDWAMGRFKQPSTHPPDAQRAANVAELARNQEQEKKAAAARLKAEASMKKSMGLLGDQ